MFKYKSGGLSFKKMSRREKCNRDLEEEQKRKKGKETEKRSKRVRKV